MFFFFLFSVCINFQEAWNSLLFHCTISLTLRLITTKRSKNPWGHWCGKKFNKFSFCFVAFFFFFLNMASVAFFKHGTIWSTISNNDTKLLYITGSLPIFWVYSWLFNNLDQTFFLTKLYSVGLVLWIIDYLAIVQVKKFPWTGMHTIMLSW